MYYDYDYNMFLNKTYNEATNIAENKTKPSLKECQQAILSSSEKYMTLEREVLYSERQNDIQWVVNALNVTVWYPLQLQRIS